MFTEPIKYTIWVMILRVLITQVISHLQALWLPSAC